jgi:Cys-rich repeat protein
MQQPHFSFVRLAPALFASALIAVTTACSITFTEPPPGECPALDELCPSLACDNGNVVVDGCPICECESTPTCEGSEAPPDGCRLDDDCEIVCDPVGCTSDADCGDGFYCAFFGPEPEPGSDDAAQRPLTGTCEPLVVEPGCTSDTDCGEGYICSFDATSPPSDRAGEAAPVAPQGVCVKLEETCTADIDCTVGSLCENGVCVVSNECFVDEDCARGFHCETLAAPGALIALPGGVCVADETPGCTSDADCNGGTCEITCESDPNCPNCDVCFFVGTCIDTGCTVNEDCDAGEICFFGDAAGDRAIACPDENNDGQCDFDVPVGGVCRTVSTEVECTVNADCADGQFCDFDTSGNRMAPPPPTCDDLANCDPIVVVPTTGVCRDLEATCTVDADCARGEICQIDQGCACPDVCIDDGNGGCLPCECPEFTGICVVPVDPTCTSDIDCREGEVCQSEDSCNCPAVCIDDGNGGCLPCECAVFGGICVPVEPTCASDVDCRDGQVCSFSLDQRPAPCLDADNDGVCDFELPPLLGVCVDLPVTTTCSTDADCANGEFCSFDAPVDGGAILPPSGVCVVLNLDPCADVRCKAGTTCVVDANGEAGCVADPTQCNDDTACSAGEFCINGDPTQCNDDTACSAGEFCINGVCSGPIQR